MKNRQYRDLSRNAFTMIELMFVIVVLGILAAVALPKFATTKNLADVSKARTDVAAIRSSIMTERQSQLIKGINTYIPKLSSNSTTLFTGDTTPDPDRVLLTYGIVAGANATTEGKWTAVDAAYKDYKFYTNGVSVLFTYNSTTGLFTCDRNNGTYGTICKKIID
jgi:general secretion pathway protein G